MCSEVGDSRAVLGRCSTPARQTVCAVDLSNDQSDAKLAKTVKGNQIEIKLK